LIGLPACRSLSCGVGRDNPRKACRQSGASRGDIPVTHRVMVRGEPEHGLERDVPVEAPIVSEDKLVEISVDVLAPQPVIGAEPQRFISAKPR